ncbi:early activation antigen CD69-like [Ranitomeya variabilis]|uniref:early activation antigen CD69-like n=1 Tax=Ranitomeya variabilis TaxID=490064 RepID=UPI0040563033
MAACTLSTNRNHYCRLHSQQRNCGLSKKQEKKIVSAPSGDSAAFHISLRSVEDPVMADYRGLAGVREIDGENRLPLQAATECPKPEDLVFFLCCCGSKKKTMVLLTALISVIFIAVVLIFVLVAVVTGGKCQTPKTIPVSSDPCEDDWIWYKRKCYYFSTNLREWEKSQSFCASRNASLAIIDGKHELDFIFRFKGSSDHWIGLRRENETEPWVWPNGSNFNDLFSIVGYSSCVLVNSGRISSALCYSDKHWICNKPDAQTMNPHF